MHVTKFQFIVWEEGTVITFNYKGWGGEKSFYFPKDEYSAKNKTVNNDNENHTVYQDSFLHLFLPFVRNQFYLNRSNSFIFTLCVENSKH